MKLLNKLIKIPHLYIVMWRKHAPLPLLLTQMLSIAFLPNYITGTLILLWLTLPCSNEIINRKWYLWYFRQLIFIALSMLYFLSK